MAEEYVVCSNGHYYNKKLGSCPYCNTTSVENPTIKLENTESSSNEPKTEIINPGKNEPIDPLKTYIPISADKKVAEEQKKKRRRIVGWIISYELDPFGIDFRIYEGRNTIGRDPSNDITIVEDSVSNKHAIILYRNGNFFLRDEMSSNGTYVNGEEILPDTPTRLKDGDLIVFGVGKAKFLFRTAEK